MKNIKLHIIILFCILHYKIFPINHCPKKIIAFYTSDQTPFQFDVGNTPAGIDIAILKSVFEKMNCKYEFLLSPHMRAIKEIEHGSGDVFLGVNKNSYNDFLLFSVPIYKKNYYLYTTKENIEKYKLNKFEDILKFPEFTVGITRGSYNGNIAEKYLNKEKYKKSFEEITGIENNLKKLFAGRIKGFIGDSNNVNWLMKEQNIELVKYSFSLSSDLKDQYVYVVFSKKRVSQTFIKLFNEKINELIDSKKIIEIFKEYFSANEIHNTILIKE